MNTYDDYLVTYRRADGELIDGEFAWVTSSELLDSLLDPTEVIMETWVLQKVETYTTEPNPFGYYEEEE